MPGLRRPRSPRRSRSLVGALTVATALFAVVACGGGDGDSEPSGPTIAPNAEAIVTASASAMGDVTSVRFEVVRTGAPVYIDSFQSIALDTIIGRFMVPGAADAILQVEVNGSLTTELGAIALDDEVWLSNPVTGEFEPLPAGYDIDPSRFFDPENGWRPLMEGLTDVELLGTESRGGDRYHIRATAPAEQVEIITAGLVRGQDVVIDFWIQPVTGLVRSAEFTTTVDGGDVDWRVELGDYGEAMEITPPPSGA